MGIDFFDVFSERPLDAMVIDFDEPGPFSDITIICQDGIRIYASEAFLALWSPVFRHLLQQTPENCNELVVNETSEEFKILLKHIYPPMLAAGNRIETEEEGCRLLEMSHEYVIPALKAAAENFLSQKLLEFQERMKKNWGKQPKSASYTDEDKKQDKTILDLLEEKLIFAEKNQAEILKGTCEQVLAQYPSPKSAILAERYILPEALNTCILFIAKHFFKIISQPDQVQMLESLSSQSILKIAMKSQKARMNGSNTTTPSPSPRLNHMNLDRHDTAFQFQENGSQSDSNY